MKRYFKIAFPWTAQMLLIVLVSLWLIVTCNQTLFAHLLKLYPWNAKNALFNLSLCVFFSLGTTLWLLLISHGRMARWVLSLVLVSSAVAAFYMDEFGVIIDHVMLDNAAKTDMQEVNGLLSWGLFFKWVALGWVPASLLWLKAPKACFKADPVAIRLRQIGLLSVLMLLVVLPCSAAYVNFVREHKMIRMFANPTFLHYSVIKWSTNQLLNNQIDGLEKIAVEPRVVEQGKPHQLIVMVVGETARFDRFALNGYSRPTNPRLSKEAVISFKNVTSCGTSTGVSVPCMFSMLTRNEFNAEKALHMQNALDVLAEQGVRVLWRDNNSDSKGVALRVPYEDFKSPANNPVCESNECRDIGMLSGLEQWVTAQKDHDMLIVLHQMGNHGPEYYRRYPDQFKQFTPICKSARLSACSREEIDNSYDNAIVYTDYFLSEIIQFLKKYDQTHATAMFYVSDHGESLGENGVYLHAAPYAIAPKEQTHIPAIAWVGGLFPYTLAQIKTYADAPLSHDDVFCTLLTTFNLQARACPERPAWLLSAN